jgi:phosphohistidine phosphatase
MSDLSSIYLVRHAIAAERGDDWPDDAKRPLTHGGTAKMRRIARGLRALDPAIDLIAASPLVRARQTAEILAEGLKPAPKLQPMPALAPGGAPAKVAEALAALRDVKCVALVGHEPDLGQLAAWLVGGRQPFPFRKGGICRIDLNGPAAGRTGQLVWMATPKMLRALAK